MTDRPLTDAEQRLADSIPPTQMADMRPAGGFPPPAEPLTDEEIEAVLSDAEDMEASGAKQWSFFERRLIATIDSLRSQLAEAEAERDAFIRLRADAHDEAIETGSRLAEVERERDAAYRENVELRAGINGTEWENNLLANAPEWMDDDVAQCDLVTRYVRWLEEIRRSAEGCVRTHGIHWQSGEVQVVKPWWESLVRAIADQSLDALEGDA